MRTGKLRHRVEWKQYTIANTVGQATPTYSTIGTYWACVIPLSGKELQVASQNRADVTHQVTMYNVGAIMPKDRLVFGSQILEISAVLKTDEVGNELKILCTEVVQ